MGNTTKRCEAPTSEVDDCAPRIFGTIATVPCGKPAAWFVETDRGDEYDACESCAIDALLYQEPKRVADSDGNDAELDEEQCLRVAS